MGGERWFELGIEAYNSRAQALKEDRICEDAWVSKEEIASPLPLMSTSFKDMMDIINHHRFTNNVVNVELLIKF